MNGPDLLKALRNSSPIRATLSHVAENVKELEIPVADDELTKVSVER